MYSVNFGRPVRFFEVSCPGVFAHLLREPHCVVGADLEGDDGAGVAEEGAGGLVVEFWRGIGGR